LGPSKGAYLQLRGERKGIDQNRPQKEEKVNGISTEEEGERGSCTTEGKKKRLRRQYARTAGHIGSEQERGTLHLTPQLSRWWEGERKN